MGKCQGRLCFIFISKFSQLIQNTDQFLTYQLQGFCHNDDIGVVSYVAGSCTQMDDSFCCRALYAVRIHMGHNIVAHQFLTLFSNIKIDFILMCFQFIDLLLRDRKAKLLLRLCQRNPESSPGAEFLVRGENILHLLTCIALGKRAYISVVHG